MLFLLFILFSIIILLNISLLVLFNIRLILKKLTKKKRLKHIFYSNIFIQFIGLILYFLINISLHVLKQLQPIKGFEEFNGEG